MKNRTIKTRYFAAAAFIILAIPVLLNSRAHGAASSPPPVSSDAIQTSPRPGMSGVTIPDAVTPPSDPQAAATIARGRYLATMGDCQSCHSVEGEPPYAGGLALGSPVGAVLSPNITPSKQYGIGNWTDAQFYDALHNGIGVGSSLLIFPKYLYPSMPYDAYSKLTYGDVMAIKAYLDSLAPAEIPDRPNQIPFPLNTRAALLGWRILFFHPQPVQYDPSWSPAIRNGAFLVQALGHCSDCHTPRNLLMASENDQFLAGGHILSQSWYAPNISAAKTGGGIGAWQPNDLVNYLYNGGSIGAGAPFGPMQQVVDDTLSRLPQSDVQDIAAYLQTGTAAQASAPPGPAATTRADGAEVYADNCARCHGGNGEGVNNNFPNLAGNQALWDGPPNNLISMVIGGFAPWHPNQSAMPAFRATLSDDQIAAVTNYLRTGFGNHGAADATAATVADLRALTNSEIDLDTGSTSAKLQNTAFDDISGHFTLDGTQLNCQLNGHFKEGATSMDLAGACDDGGGGLLGHATINGQTIPVKLTVYDVMSGGALSAVQIYGPIAGQTFNASIAMVNAND